MLQAGGCRFGWRLFGLAACIGTLLLVSPPVWAGQDDPQEEPNAVSARVEELRGVFGKWKPKRNPGRFGKRISDQVRKVRFDRHGPVIMVRVHESRYANGTRVLWSEWPLDGKVSVSLDQIDITSHKVDGGGGLRVGSSAEHVKAQFGPPVDDQAPVWVYSHGNEYIYVAFYMTDGRVSKIVWWWPSDPAD